MFNTTWMLMVLDPLMRRQNVQKPAAGGAPDATKKQLPEKIQRPIAGEPGKIYRKTAGKGNNISEEQCPFG